MLIDRDMSKTDLRAKMSDHFFWTLSIQSFIAGFFCTLILPEEPQAVTANHRPDREQTVNANFPVFQYLFVIVNACLQIWECIYFTSVGYFILHIFFDFDLKYWKTGIY